ncbi:MAG: hypothetical protein LBF61_04345 [Azoarcus sp.]|jgi:hypothetical protein|nr:hypothetical protein [Azoarcus sp.]
MKKYEFTIARHPASEGHAWQMRLLENGSEVGGGQFPFTGSEDGKGAREAYADAYGTA